VSIHYPWKDDRGKRFISNQRRFGHLYKEEEGGMVIPCCKRKKKSERKKKYSLSGERTEAALSGRCQENREKGGAGPASSPACTTEERNREGKKSAILGVILLHKY